MLVLSRKINEEIVIAPGTPHEVTISLVEIRGNKARIGITADPEIQVYRREVWDDILRDRRLAEQIRTLKDDPAKLAALADELDAQQAKIAESIAANTTT